jgi:hypothetical protein
MRNSEILSQIDKLIDWYERFKPQAGKRIPVFCTQKKLEEVLGVSAQYDPSRGFVYRGRVLVATDGDANEHNSQ